MKRLILFHCYLTFHVVLFNKSIINFFSASIVPSLGILGVAYVGCDKVAAQLLLALPGALAGAVYAGNQMNHIALSPKYAGTMYGITNAAANMCGFLAPYVIGLIIEGRVSILSNLLFIQCSLQTYLYRCVK